MKTKLKFIGLICVECGDPVTQEHSTNGTDGCWTGPVKHFHCWVCRRSYILLFSEKRAFVAVLTGPFPWVDLRSAGMVQYDPDEIPF